MCNDEVDKGGELAEDVRGPGGESGLVPMHNGHGARTELRDLEHALLNNYQIDPEHKRMLPDEVAKLAFNCDDEGNPGEGDWEPRIVVRAMSILTKLIADEQKSRAVVLAQRYAELAAAKKTPARVIHAHFTTAEQSRLADIARSVGIENIFGDVVEG